ncbi:MAG: hypothetical protein RIR11_2198 [Bacteroidota bacterium]|jgi:two-component system OmpR family response regulator
MEAPHLLLVDDDQVFSTLTQEFLEMKGFRVTLKHSGEEGWTAFRQDTFHLCILDIKMPFKDGFSLASDIRSVDSRVPIVFLTGVLDKDRRIEGFHLGADDYITKPFSMEELHLRLKAILRRVGVQDEIVADQEKKIYHIGKYRFDPHTRELYLEKNTIKMTAIEARLLEYFCQSPDGIIDRTTTLRRIWNDDDQLRGRSLNVYVSKLRQYLREDAAIEILNVHGEGYQLVVR